MFLLTLSWAGVASLQAQIVVRILPPSWTAPEPPQEFHEFGRRGFHDGIEAARRDVNDRRSLDADKQEAFRHPPVPGEFQDEYRHGFQRGYDEVVHNLVAQEATLSNDTWVNDIPAEYHDAGRRGFHDGIEAARHDVESHQKPDLKRHNEYKHPPLSRGPEGDEYRTSFQRGYDSAFDHLLNHR